MNASSLQREVNELRRRNLALARGLVEVLRVMRERDAWLRAAALNHHGRLQALDGLNPQGQPWPELTIPRELAGLLEE